MGGFTARPVATGDARSRSTTVGDYYDLQLNGTGEARGSASSIDGSRPPMLAELFYIGRNALEAEALGLAKLDAGV